MAWWVWMSVSFYWWWAVSPYWKKTKTKQDNVSQQAFTNAVTIYKVKLIFPLSMIKIWLLNLLEFEIERNDRQHFMTKENYTWDLESNQLIFWMWSSLTHWETSKMCLTEILWIFQGLEKCCSTINVKFKYWFAL